MHPYTVALQRHLPSHLINRIRVAGGPQRHLPRIEQDAVKAHSQAPLPVYGHHDRNIAGRLQTVGKDGLAYRIGLKEAHPAPLVTPHARHSRIVIGPVFVGMDAHHDKLRDFLLQCQCVQHGIGPSPARFRRNGHGGGVCRRHQRQQQKGGDNTKVSHRLLLANLENT